MGVDKQRAVAGLQAAKFVDVFAVGAGEVPVPTSDLAVGTEGVGIVVLIQADLWAKARGREDQFAWCGVGAAGDGLITGIDTRHGCDPVAATRIGAARREKPLVGELQGNKAGLV